MNQTPKDAPPARWDIGNLVMAGNFEDVVAVAAIAQGVEGPDSVGPDSVDAAEFEEEVFWLV
ncbi:MAG: hypothetical protein WB627_07475 [Candidatus Acidiferrum sp.]